MSLLIGLIILVVSQADRHIVMHVAYYLCYESQIWPQAFATKMVAFFFLFCSCAAGPILIVCRPLFRYPDDRGLSCNHRHGCRNSSRRRKNEASSSAWP